MQTIPKPELLSVSPEHRDQRAVGDDPTAQELESDRQALAFDLQKTADYADQLWTRLSAVREYLMTAVADGGLLGEDHATWSAWAGIYAETTSLLAGPAGDSGFGAEEARLAAQNTGGIDLSRP